MTAEQLKNSIYQLAVGGKLVEQRSDEGTAEDLYKHILDKRKSLLKNNEIKDIKGIEPIEDIPFDIPNSWKWVRLGNIASVISDGTHRTPTYVDEGIPFLSVQNISGGFIDMSKAKYITPEEHEALIQRCKPSKDDILVCRIGTLGKAIKINVDFEFSIFVSLGLLRLVDTRIADYVTCVINSGYGKKWIDEVKVGGGTHTNKINLNSFPNFLIPLPPLREQQRILNKLIEFDELLSEYAKASTRLNTLNASFPDQMKKSILQQAVMGKLVPQDPNDEPASVVLKRIREVLPKQRPSKDDLNYDSMNFDIPETWEWAELNELFDFVDYRGKTPNKIDQGVFLITASNIRRGFMEYTRKEYISEEEYLDRQSRGITHKGDLLFTTEAPMGNAAICDLNRCSCGQRIITFQPFCDQTVVPELYMYFILSPAFQLELLANCTGTTAKGIKADKLKHFRVPLPPYAEQKRIVQKLQEVIPTTSILNTMQ